MDSISRMSLTDGHKGYLTGSAFGSCGRRIDPLNDVRKSVAQMILQFGFGTHVTGQCDQKEIVTTDLNSMAKQQRTSIVYQENRPRQHQNGPRLLSGIVIV